MRHAATLLFLCAAARASTHPNFTGTWKLSAAEYYIVDQSAERLRVIMIIQDQLGTRTFDTQGAMDGQPHPRGTRRDTPDGVLHNRRAIQLSSGGLAIGARRTRLSPAPEQTWTEPWKRQDPVLPPTACFQKRDAALAPDATPLDHGLVALYVSSGQTRLASAQRPDLGGGELHAPLAIVPTLTIGQIELSNVPFWVVADKRLGAPGVLGIDVLLALQTLRWNREGTIGIGFPSAPADLLRANICFDGSTPIAQVFHQHDAQAFVVDTGNTASSFFPSIATQFPGDIAAGLQASSQVAGYVGRATLKLMVLPAVGLRVGEWETDLRPAAVSLDRARSVAFDFAAVRLTLEGVR